MGVIATCRELEAAAARLYTSFAGRTRKRDLGVLWNRMAAEEHKHAATVDAIGARKDVVLPAVAEADLRRIRAHAGELLASADRRDLDDAQMLTLAAALELSEMDELFGALCRAAGIDPDRGRASHMQGLVAAASAIPGAGTAVRHLVAAFLRLERRGRSLRAQPLAAAAP